MRTPPSTPPRQLLQNGIGEETQGSPCPPLRRLIVKTDRTQWPVDNDGAIRLDEASDLRHLETRLSHGDNFTDAELSEHFSGSAPDHLAIEVGPV